MYFTAFGMVYIPAFKLHHHLFHKNKKKKKKTTQHSQMNQ